MEIALVMLGGCSSSQTDEKLASSENASLKAENSSLKENQKIVGSYQDDQDQAAITLNANGTGRYVYADPVNSNTDDQLTWTKNFDGTYASNLKDADVTSVLTGKLSGSTLTVSGDSNWHTETFTKVNGSLDLDKFLSEHETSSSSSSSTPRTSQTVDSPNAAIALAESTYGNNNGDWQWVCLYDNNGYLMDNQYYFVKAISQSELQNGSMTGTAKSVRVYIDGRIVEQ